MLSCVRTRPSSKATSSSRPRASGAVAIRLKRALTSRSRISGTRSGPHLLGDGVEQAVDEAALALVVEGVGDVDIFANHARGRDVGARDQLIGAGAKDRAHRAVEPFERPPFGKAVGDQLVDLLVAAVGAGDDVVEKVAL